MTICQKRACLGTSCRKRNRFNFAKINSGLPRKVSRMNSKKNRWFSDSHCHFWAIQSLSVKNWTSGNFIFWKIDRENLVSNFKNWNFHTNFEQLLEKNSLIEIFIYWKFRFLKISSFENFRVHFQNIFSVSAPPVNRRFQTIFTTASQADPGVNRGFRPLWLPA